MKPTKLLTIISMTAILFVSTVHSAQITGELKQWHKVTLTFDGPESSEQASNNPFMNYRMQVTFSNGQQTLVVPGYFAADGDAANSSAIAGNKWRCHFIPSTTGTWTWSVAFRQGFKIAVSDLPMAGQACSFDGATGSFKIGPSDKKEPDFRAKGTLQYVGEHYLRFAGSRDYFLKGGADSPETFLGYADFDGTRDNGGIPLPRLENGLRHYKTHVKDWQPDDPTWQNGKGKGMIGALNYLSSKGMNSVYFLTMNVTGDGDDVWPWMDPYGFYNFDVSKLDQWEIVFSHMDKLGLMLHVVTQETENDHLIDGGTLGDRRKLYYRELIARFGHHLAITWNLGEENNNKTEHQRAFADYIAGHDPYGHPVVVHNGIYREEFLFRPLLAHPTFHGPSMQMTPWTRTHEQTLIWRKESAKAGHPWMVCLDEFGPAGRGTLTDAEDYWHDNERKDVLWANLMAGGAGVEWYFGWQNDGSTSDLANEDWRNREHMWEMTKFALDFFHAYLPFWEMEPADHLTSLADDYCFAKEGEVYAVYLRNGGSTKLNLGTHKGPFKVQWYNPRTGGALVAGTKNRLTGPGKVSIGKPNTDLGMDWVALITM